MRRIIQILTLSIGELSMKSSALLSAFFIAFGLLISGCDETEVTLEMTVDVAGLTADERQFIDRVSIDVVGLEAPLQFSESAATAFKSGAFVASSEAIAVKEPTTVFVRASVYAGDFEVAGQTQRVTLNADSGSVELRFELSSQVSPNGCRLVQSPSEVGLSTEADPTTFDVVADSGGYQLAYSDLAKTDGDIYTVKLDAQGKVASAPIRLTDTSSRSVFPSLTKLSDGFAIAWQNAIKDSMTNAHGMQVGKLDSTGRLIRSGSLVFATSTNEVLPMHAVMPSGQVALVWHEYFGWGERVVVARPLYSSNSSDSIYGLDSRKVMASKNTTDIAIAASNDGFGVVWSDKNANGQDYGLQFAKLDANFNVTQQSTLRTSIGDARKANIVATSSGFLVSWEDMRSELSSEVFTSAVTANGTRLTESKLTDAIAASGAKSPRLAWNGTSAAMIFTQLRDENVGGNQVFLTRISDQGAKIGAGDLQISQTLDTYAMMPRIVPLGAGYMIFWTEEKAYAPSKLMVATVDCDN